MSEEDGEGKNGSDGNELAPAGNYPTIIMADLAKSKLEMNGIHSEIFDGEHARIMWFHTAAIGGIRLMVRKKDLAAAEAILTEDLGIEGETVSDEEEIGEEAEYCSVCHSKQLLRTPIAEDGAPGFVGGLLNKVAGYSEVLTCGSCGNRWKV